MASLRERSKADGTPYVSVLYRIEGRQSSLSFLGDQALADATYAKELIDSVGAVRALELLKVERIERSSLTLEAYLRRHIEHLTGVEQKTIDDYQRYVRLDIAPSIGAIPLKDLSPDDLSVWVKQLEDKGNKPKTIANKYGFLSGALGKAVPKHIPSNPAANRRLPRGEGGEQDDEMQMLTEEEFAHLLASTTEYWRPLIEFLVASGMRWGEASALKPSDVDRKAGTVKVRRAWKYSSNGYTIGPPKTKRSRRTINMPKSVLDKLDYSHEWLFVNRTGGPVRYYGFKPRVWDKAVARAGFDPKPTPHDLRHTFASWNLNAGVAITVVSRQLGHESIQITVDTYGDLDRSSAQASADVIGAILGG